MSGNFDGIKTQKYGVEVERTGLTRADAAKAISKILGGSPEHLGGSYDKYNVHDGKDRKWSIVYDSSIRCVDKSGCSASRNYAVELVTPVLEYEDNNIFAVCGFVWVADISNCTVCSRVDRMDTSNRQTSSNLAFISAISSS